MKDHQQNARPEVGIFFVVEGELILKGVALDEAEPWGRFLNALGHQDYWAQLRRQKLVPSELEYDKPPRGRVVYDKSFDRFYLYADKCILADKKLIKDVIAQLHLSGQRVEITSDPHYHRCR